MTGLREALQMTSWRWLRTIGRQRGLRLSSNLPKADLVDRLARVLPDPDNLAAALARLAGPERDDLDRLLAAGARLPRRYLPDAPLETLRRLGLVFYDRASDDVFVPADFLPHLPTPHPPPGSFGQMEGAGPAHPAAARAYTEPAWLAAHDLGCLLALLQRQEVRPLHGRWLPPRALADWGARCAVPPRHPGARGELQTGRRRFLHYLAGAAGLLAPDLNPTPAAWLWLEAAPADRLNALWQAILAPDPAQWRAYRLPGYDLTPHPDKLVTAVIQALPGLDPSDPLACPAPSICPQEPGGRCGALAYTLLRRQPALNDLLPPTLDDAENHLAAAIADLLAGPLVWLGVLAADRIADKADGIADQQAAPGEDKGPGHDRSSLSVTAWGGYWLGLAPPPETPPRPHFALTPVDPHDERQGALIFSLAGALPDPADLMCLEAVGSREQGAGSRGEEGHTLPTPYSILPTPCSILPTPDSLLPASYRITAASFARALHHGWSAPALLDALNRLAGRPLTGQERALLRAWAAAAGRMAIRRLTVLEVTDPEIISRLASTRRGRSLIVRTLSPRVVVVDAAHLDQLVRRLARQEGVGPGVASREYGVGSKGDISTPCSRLPTPDAGAAHAWLALRVYQGLGDVIRLPARTPQALWEDLAARADPAALAAAETLAEAVLEALREMIVGRAPFPPWPEDGLPVEHSLAVIQEAMARGEALEMDYYTAGRDALTHRVVEPWRLEQRGDTLYLVGFCQRAGAERVFRLDRIRSLSRLTSHSPGTTPAAAPRRAARPRRAAF